MMMFTPETPEATLHPPLHRHSGESIMCEFQFWTNYPFNTCDLFSYSTDNELLTFKIQLLHRPYTLFWVCSQTLSSVTNDSLWIEHRALKHLIDALTIAKRPCIHHFSFSFFRFRQVKLRKRAASMQTLLEEKMCHCDEDESCKLDSRVFKPRVYEGEVNEAFKDGAPFILMKFAC